MLTSAKLSVGYLVVGITRELDKKLLLLSKSLTVDFIYFIFSLSFYFSLPFNSYFLFLEQLGLGVISHAVTSVTSWWHSHETDHKTQEKKVEGSRTKWRYIAWTTHAGQECLSRIINIADACINLGHWPKYFKVSTTVVIPKPNKTSYNTPKAFRPIVLLNTLGKLIEKVIADRLQYLVASNDFIHPSQLGGLKYKSTSDAGIALTHIIRSR